MNTIITADVWIVLILIGISSLSLPFLLISCCCCKFKLTTLYAWFASSVFIAVLWHSFSDNWHARDLFWANSEASRRGSFSTWTSTWIAPENTMLLIPADEAELQRIITNPATAKPIRVVGSGHTWSATGYSDGTLVDIRNLNKVIALGVYQDSIETNLQSINKNLPLPQRAGGRITVQAGMKVQDAVQFLAARGFCFYGVGSIRAQSIGGIVSHGVHGPHPDGFNRHVIGLKVLYANGSLATLQKSSDMFMWRSSMGMLGVILEVTVEFFPQFLLTFERSPIGSWEDFDSISSHLDPLTSTTFTGFLYPSRCGSIGWKRVGYFSSFSKTPHELDNQTSFKDKLMLHFNNHMHPAMQYMYAGFGTMTSCLEQFMADMGHSTLLSPVEKDILQNDGLIPQLYEIIDYEYMIPIRNCKLFAYELLERQMYGRILIPICLRLVRKENSCMAMAYEDSCVFAIQSMRGNTHTIHFDLLEKRVASLGGHAHFGKVAATSFQYYTYPCLEQFRNLRQKLDPNNLFLNPFLEYLISPRPSSRDIETYEFAPIVVARQGSTQRNILFGLFAWATIFIALSMTLFYMLKKETKTSVVSNSEQRAFQGIVRPWVKRANDSRSHAYVYI